jgi:hypothetical protein
MWALIKENKVVACIAGVSYEEAIKLSDGNLIVEMTLENSPASYGDYYDGKKFYRKEENNG